MISVTVDAKEVKELARRLANFSEDPFTKKERQAIATKGTPPLVTASRQIAKKRRHPQKNVSYTQVWYSKGKPRFAHIPGNLKNAIRRTPRRYVSRSGFAWIGVAFKGVTPAGQHRVGDSSVPLFGAGFSTSYAPYAFKAYGDASGSSYTNWNNKVLEPAVQTGSPQAFSNMIAETVKRLDEKIRKL